MASSYQKRLKTKAVLHTVFATPNGLKNKECRDVSHKRPFMDGSELGAYDPFLTRAGQSDVAVAQKTTHTSAHLNRYLVNTHKLFMFDIMMRTESEAASRADLPVGSAIYAKYGEASVAGFQAVPDLLLKHQHDLGLSPTDMTVLLNVLMHWWYPEKKPFPRSTTIAKRMGVTTRTVRKRDLGPTFF